VAVKPEPLRQPRRRPVEAGVQAEIDPTLISTTVLRLPTARKLRVFERLRSASQNRTLAAFSVLRPVHFNTNLWSAK